MGAATNLAPSRVRLRKPKWFRIQAGSLSKGGEPPVPMTTVHPKASDNLLEALRSASIDEGHCTLMSTVIEKVRSAKSRLTEACASLLTGFEVSNKIVREYHISIDSSP